MHRDELVRGKGRFMITQSLPTTEVSSERYPLLLTTGRILSQYNVGAQTRRTANTAWHDQDLLEIHPSDAQARGIQCGDRVQVSSRAGTTQLVAVLCDGIFPGGVFIIFQFADSV